MRDLIDASRFLALAVDPDFDEPLGEHAAAGEVLMIRFERIERLVEGGGQAVDLLLFLLGKIEEVEVVGTPAAGGGIDLVYDTVDTRHQDGCVGVVGVAGGIGVAKLEAL